MASCCSCSSSLVLLPIIAHKKPSPIAAPPSASLPPLSTPAPMLLSRRLALPLLGLSLLLTPSRPALAKDIPLFGIRKRVEQAEKEVVEEVQGLVKEGEQLVQEGEKEVASVAGAVTAVVSNPVGSGESPPPVYQAGAVVGVELVAVLVASSVVNGLVSQS